MSQENVELVRSVIEAYISGDRDAYVAFMAEDVEIALMCLVSPRQSGFVVVRSSGAFSPISTRAGRGVLRRSSRASSPLGDRVLARADWGGRGRASGIDLRSSLTSIYTVRDRQIAKIEYFFNHAQALKAVGLRE
jgi:ketosteroid isomerase-like protein